MSGNTRRSGLFLLELVLDLFLFVLCATVCVALLIHARSMSRESRELTRAVYLAQSVAEEWRNTGEFPDWSAPDKDGFTGKYAVEGKILNIAIYQGERLVYTLEGVAAP